MAHLWFRDEDEVWSAMPLDGHAVDIMPRPPRVLAEGFRFSEEVRAALMRVSAGDSPVWVLLVAADDEVRVNGFPPIAGLRVLRDRDEIRASPPNTLYFSTETLAQAEPFPETQRSIFCGRCRQPMQKGEMAVRCPQCSIWFHQTDKLPCWLYSPTCAFCPQPTALDAGLAWTPEA